MKFGPTVAVFRGEAGLGFDDATRTCAIEGRGTKREAAALRLPAAGMACSLLCASIAT